MRISDWSSDVCSSDLSHSGRKRLPSNPPLILISRRIRIRARVNRRLGRPGRIRVKLAQRINQPPAPNPVIPLIGRIKPQLVQPPSPAPPLPWIKEFRITYPLHSAAFLGESTKKETTQYP